MALAACVLHREGLGLVPAQWPGESGPTGGICPGSGRGGPPLSWPWQRSAEWSCALRLSLHRGHRGQSDPETGLGSHSRLTHLSVTPLCVHSSQTLGVSGQVCIWLLPPGLLSPTRKVAAQSFLSSSGLRGPTRRKAGAWGEGSPLSAWIQIRAFSGSLRSQRRAANSIFTRGSIIFPLVSHTSAA